MSSPVGTALKIADALNYMYGCHVVVNNKSFFGKEQRPVKMYIVQDSWYDQDTGAWRDEILFKSASGVYACLFLRDLLFSFQGKELPNEDNRYQNIRDSKDVYRSIDFMLANYKQEESVVSESQYREVDAE